jgi:hypothetical protein
MNSVVTVLIARAQNMLPQAWSYLDPGSGSMLFQVLIAGLLSLLYCGKSCLSYLRGVLSGHQSLG